MLYKISHTNQFEQKKKKVCVRIYLISWTFQGFDNQEHQRLMNQLPYVL